MSLNTAHTSDGNDDSEKGNLEHVSLELQSETTGTRFVSAMERFVHEELIFDGNRL